MLSRVWGSVIVVMLLAGVAVADGESEGVLLEKGIYMEQTAGDLDGALSVYQQIIDAEKARRPYIAQAYLRQGLCYLRLGRQEDARKVLGTLIGDFPEQTELVAKAREALGSNISEPDKRRAEELSQSGWARWRERNLADAETAFQEAVQLDPGNTSAWNGLGWSCHNQGKRDDAEKAFQQCIAIDPTHAAALNGLGWIAQGRGKTDEAVGYWTKAVESAPGATAALNGLVSTHLTQENYAEVAKYAQMWLDAEPGNAEAEAALAKARENGVTVEQPVVQVEAGPDGSQRLDIVTANWGLAGNDPRSYAIGEETQRLFANNPTRFLKCTVAEPKGFGTLMQTVNAGPARDRRLRMKAQVKAEGVEKWAGLWMRIDAKDGACLGFDNMQNRPITGALDWTAYEIVLDVPRDGAAIAFGILLEGRGEVLISDLHFEVVGADVPTTAMK